MSPVTLAPDASSLDLAVLNPMLWGQDAMCIVSWAAAEFGDSLVMSSSFGVDSAVLLHMAASVLPRIKVIMIDTGYLFPATFGFMEQLRRRLDLNVWVYRTRNDPFDYLARSGESDPQRRLDIASCCGGEQERAVRAGAVRPVT